MVGHIFIDGDIGVTTTKETVKADIETYPHATEWIVHIDSGGGSVFTGYSIGTLIRNLGKPTTAQIGAVCASIATYIACCCETVDMSPDGTFMIHLPTGNSKGTSTDLRKDAQMLDQMQNELIDRYMKKVAKKGITKEQLATMMESETFMSPKEAMAMGFVDNVREKFKAVARWDIKNFNNMENTLTREEAKGMFEAFGTKLDAWYKNIEKKFKNMVELTLEDGSVIQSDAATIDDLVGSTVTDEMGNPLTAGQYVTADGTTLVIADQGKCSSAGATTPPADAGDQTAKVDALAKEVAALKEMLQGQQAATKQAEQAAVVARAETTEFKNTLSTFKDEYEQLKNRTFGDGNPPPDAPDKMKAGSKQRDPMLESMAASLGAAYVTSR